MKPGQSCSAGVGSSLKGALRGLILAVTLLVVPGGWQDVRADDLSPFLGSFVGRATVEDLATGTQYQRDLDIVVVPHRNDGLRIDWVTVGLVDGRRDVPGVMRWAQTALFEPSGDNDFMIEVGDSSVFEEREAPVPIEGDAIRWAHIEGDVLHTSSFIVLEDGRYELHVYQRILTDIGMDIHFERIVDGEIVRRVIGKTVRAG